MSSMLDMPMVVVLLVVVGDKDNHAEDYYYDDFEDIDDDYEYNGDLYYDGGENGK